MSLAPVPGYVETPLDRDEVEVSVVIPCLNEEASIARCVQAARHALAVGGFTGEVIVVDNDSEDLSAKLAAEAGATVIHEQVRGYGQAYLTGLAQARGRFVVMADADLTYDFDEIPRFVARLAGGADLVIGDRMDNIEPGAMPWLHRYIGNPLLSGMLNVFFGAGVRDAHCGMRALRRDSLPRLDLRATGMEFASEMVVRAAQRDLVIEQLPIHYRPREGTSKLSSFRDGWRHLRFLLVHSPLYLFIIPGLAMVILGLLATIVVLADIRLFGRVWEMHALIAGCLGIIVGVQVLGLGLCAQFYSVYHLGARDSLPIGLRRRIRLEHGLLLGTLVTLAGLVVGGFVVADWISVRFGRLSLEPTALLAATLTIIGVQIFFVSFLLSIIGQNRSSGERRDTV
jgi:glycosyltransferase involved in cell wall biosynthesis